MEELPEYLYIVLVNNQPQIGFESHGEALEYVEKLKVNKDKDIVEIYATPYPDPTPDPEEDPDYFEG